MREIEVVLRPRALADAHLTPSELADRLAGQDVVVAVGRVDDAHESLTVMATSEATTVESIAALPIAMGSHGPIPLSTVADVLEGAEDRTVSTTGPDGDVVVVTLSRVPGASAPDVVDEAMATRRASPPIARVSARASAWTPSTINRSSYATRCAVSATPSSSGSCSRCGPRRVSARPARRRRRRRRRAHHARRDLRRREARRTDLNLMSLGRPRDRDRARRRRRDRHRRGHRAPPRGGAAGPRRPQRVARAISSRPCVGTTLTTVVVFAPLALLAGVVGRFFGALAVTLCAAVLLSLRRVGHVGAARRGATGPRCGRAAGSGGERGRASLRTRWCVASRAAPGSAPRAAGVLAARGGARRLGADGAPRPGSCRRWTRARSCSTSSCPPGTSLEETDRVAAPARPHARDHARRRDVHPPHRAARWARRPRPQQNRGDILVRLVDRALRGPVDRRGHRLACATASRRRCPRRASSSCRCSRTCSAISRATRARSRCASSARTATALDENRAHASRSGLEPCPSSSTCHRASRAACRCSRRRSRPSSAAALGVTLRRDIASDLGGRAGGPRRRACPRRRSGSIGVRAAHARRSALRPDAIASLPLAYGGRVGAARPRWRRSVARAGRPCSSARTCAR